MASQCGHVHLLTPHGIGTSAESAAAGDDAAGTDAAGDDAAGTDAAGDDAAALLFLFLLGNGAADAADAGAYAAGADAAHTASRSLDWTANAMAASARAPAAAATLRAPSKIAKTSGVLHQKTLGIRPSWARPSTYSM